jgi:hypothetical protein
MFPIQAATDKARELVQHSHDRLHSELHTAEQLVAEARRTDEEAQQNGEEVIEELAPSEAEEVIDEEYRPLMDDAGEGAEGQGRSKKKGKRGSASGDKVKVRKLEVWIAYLAFFVRFCFLFFRFFLQLLTIFTCRSLVPPSFSGGTKLSSGVYRSLKIVTKR